jgi:aromatic ring hydroxylase
MAIRTGAEYVGSLRDTRDVWLAGSRVADVTGHAALAGCVGTLAGLYHQQHDPALADLLTRTSPSSGERVSAAFHLPSTAAELQARRGMIEFITRQQGGTMGRLPDYVPLILIGLLNQREHLTPAANANLQHYFELCREEDLCLSHSFADPQIDRSKPSNELKYLQIVDEDSSSLAVRGTKTVATLAPFSNEYLVLTPPRTGLRDDQAICFSVPVDTPGLRLICRSPFSGGSHTDHPLSSRFDEMDAWAVFDDVRIPRERVFLAGDAAALRPIWRTLNVWAYYHLLIRIAVKAELFVGVCQLISRVLGTADFPNVRTEIADVIRYLETVRAFLRAAEADAVVTRAGIMMPSPRPLFVGHMYAVEHHPRLLDAVRGLSGQGILMTLGEADLSSVEIAERAEAYLTDGRVGAVDRMRLFRLAWDLACSPFAARQLLFETFNARDLTKNRLEFAQAYDSSACIQAAERLAGIHSNPIERATRNGDGTQNGPSEVRTGPHLAGQLANRA